MTLTHLHFAVVHRVFLAEAASLVTVLWTSKIFYANSLDDINKSENKSEQHRIKHTIAQICGHHVEITLHYSDYPELINLFPYMCQGVSDTPPPLPITIIWI